jgi:hypothetical protein
MLSLKLSFAEKSSKSGLNVRQASNYARRQPGHTIIPLASSRYGHNAQAINAREDGCQYQYEFECQSFTDLWPSALS